jgi:hypothetical protein
MRIITRLTGTKPLLMHNVQLADPMNTWSKRIEAITKKKRNKTTEDLEEIARLEWHGSLYINLGRIIMPTGNVLKCFNETAKMTREGKKIQRSISPTEIQVPFVYDGPEDIEKLWEREDFRDITLVGVGKNRVRRCRPIFRAWMVSIEWELLTDVIDYEEFLTIVNRAGVVEGLGDNRTNGYGRFTVDVTEVKNLAEAA